MRKLFNHILLAGAAVLLSCFTSCTDETLAGDGGNHSDKGTLLNLTATLETDQVQTRLAELGGDAAALANIINGKTPDGTNDNPDGLKHIGLYIYYADDYAEEKDNLANPYIRNLRCNIVDGKITPCDEDGNTLTDEKDKIYIYDRMTIVAFYPYNEDMNLEKNFFKKKIDEEAYPISRSIYENQTYIPYRTQTDVNPTNAYFRELGFSVKHTAKIEIVLVSKELNNLPTTSDFKSGDIKILPKLDPYNGTQDGGTGYTSDTREHWLDGINTYPNTGAPTGGLFARQYVAYLWTSTQGDKHHDNTDNKYGEPGVEGDHNHWDNIIKPNDIVFESKRNAITLFSSQRVNLAEQRVYRYGYNMDTGEIFIPTSSQLVNDAKSLQDVSCDKTSAYQVCDIDLAGQTWKPKSIADGTYDGGGHKITGLSITSAAGNVQTGLFGNINGNSFIRNVNLISPSITVSGADSCFVGALCGYINPRLTKEQKDKLRDNLPAGLSEVVKAELLKGLIQEMTNSTSQIISSRVQDPTITVTGSNAWVGALCGAAGDKDEQGKYFAKIWDSYSLGGKITVNGETASPDNVKALVGGLCGANNGRIIHSYSTTTATAMYQASGETKNLAAGLSRKGYYADEFAKLKTKKNKPRFKVEDCYVLLKNDNDDANEVNAFSTSTWPVQADWVTYTGKWPVYSNDWKDPDEEDDAAAGHPSIRSYWKNIGSNPSTYPTLLWEREY